MHIHILRESRQRTLTHTDKGSQTMIVVSGCPRSGTSLMMNILKEALGEDRIMGSKFPMEDRLLGKTRADKEKLRAGQKKFLENNPYMKYVAEKRTEIAEKRQQKIRAHEEERLKIQEKRNAQNIATLKDRTKAARRRILTKEQRLEKNREQLENAKDMNPNGFYECKYTVQGISYGRGNDVLGELVRIKEDKKETIVKIVSQGLARSDGDFIESVVFMVRDPRAVAKSQEKLNRSTKEELNGKASPMHSAKMFNKVSYDVAIWLRAHPEIPVHIVNYDNLIDDPETTMTELFEFIGSGRWDDVKDVIDTSLRRSEPEDREGAEWEIAAAIFEPMKSGDWEGVIEARNRVNKELPRQNFFCARTWSGHTRFECDACRSHFHTRNNFRQKAIDNGIDWENTPCAYDCLEEGKTIEESISGNHWKAEEHLYPARCIYAKVSDELAMPLKPCQGRKVECSNPDIKLDTVTEKQCSKERCKEYTE